MQFLRAIGTTIRLSSALSINITVTITDGGIGSSTYTGGALTIAAGSFRTADYCSALASTIVSWLQAKIAADATVAATGTPIVDIAFSPGIGADSSRFELTLVSPACDFIASSLPASFSAASINNTNGAFSNLGLAYRDPSSPTRNASIVSGEAVFSGLFQPRSIFVFERSEIDEGEDDRPAQFVAHKLASGGLRTYVLGTTRISKQRLRIVDLDPDVCGPPIEVALATSINADRNTLNIPAGTTVSLSGIEVAFSLPVLIEAGDYIEIQGFVARVRSVTPTTIVLCETIPTTISISSLSYIRVVSEVHALWNEALRLGEILVYNTSDSTGEILWYPQSYCLASDETPRFFGERRDIGNALYSYTFSLLRRDIEG